VGENGPELFVPDGTGTIIPNGGMGGGNLHFAPVYNINAPNGDAQLRAALPQLLAETAAKAKRDLLDAFTRSGFGAPRTA
jgi:phage-related minor tail protein